MPRILLISLDSVGIDPIGHDRKESVYSDSRFLFPSGSAGDLLTITKAPMPGALVETRVVGESQHGGIECAITYTSIFSGQSAADKLGLLEGLGLNEQGMSEMIRSSNLFRRFRKPCLANAIFPFHLSFLGSSYVQAQLPHLDRKAVEATLLLDGLPVHLSGSEKHGFAELFTLGEINQNIFVYAALDAGVMLRSWNDVRNDEGMTGTMTHELESRFNWVSIGQSALPQRTPVQAAAVLASLVRTHDFTFYKYQLADLVSHTGRVDLAKAVFATIELFLESVLQFVNAKDTVVIVTSDHGHLEQVGFSRGHPKSLVPTWYFGQDALRYANRLRRPEALFHVISELAG